MEAHTQPLFLSPALPSDLLQFIINHCTHPTTLVICSERTEFLSSLTQDIKLQQQQPPTPHEPHEPDKPLAQDTTATDPNNNPLRPTHQSSESQPTNSHPLLTSPLHTVATARHIRTVFVPTVTHLRAFLSVFSLSPSPAFTNPKFPSPPAPPPPPPPPHSTSPNPGINPLHHRPLLLVYNFLALHRSTSEWSVQGLGNSAAVLVEAARRTGLRAVVVEGRSKRMERSQEDDEGEEQGRAEDDRVREGKGADGSGGSKGEMPEMLAEKVPVLSGSARRTTGLDFDGGVGQGEGSGWAGRTLEVEKVLGRWFRFGIGEWDSR